MPRLAHSFPILFPLFAAAFAAVSGLSAQAPPGDGGVQVYQTVLKSTAWIESKRPDGAATGSGTLIDRPRRLVLTNYHVVGDIDRATVIFPAYRDGKLIAERSYYKSRERTLGIRGRVVARDRAADLALIQIDEVPAGVQALPLAAEGVTPGQTVHSLGNPGGSGALWVYTPGKVRQVYQKRWSAKAGNEILKFEAKVIETDSPTNPGDSGGPLVNDRAELVGVTQGGATNANLLSTFVDLAEVRRFLNSRSVRDLPGETVAEQRREPLTVQDGGKFFSTEAVQTANAAIRKIKESSGCDLLVETFASVPKADLERVRAMKTNDRLPYFQKWAEDRAREMKVNGVVALICRDPSSLYVLITETGSRRISSNESKRMRETLLQRFREKKYDDGLAELTKQFGEAVAEQRP